ncbi:CarD family transcriptional regulator [Boudabousia liubingyangii]|uniref:CarD family transcriptional regulator n=1 Tax=Boudabousia liubingyangii TaxID=1921764 RepID=A0A1Q5PK02_9ACTO|nr:CarD family transcriptional regulator [Boudabousia liubingyangii]OKL46554.1 CarD family transcriptional regulator [Boudabousia liubingyangii]OKL46861.1 CarD family transcriptional regulator [Boudabousia liubingyangii]
MAFKVGETVVYPHHGAAVIEEIKERIVRGELRTYLSLRVTQGDLRIQVPAKNVEMVGMRDVIDEGGLEEVVSVLMAENPEEPSNWSRRYKANVEKIASGDTLAVAEVVRDLTRRERERGLSAGEKRMLLRARQILVSELALARSINEEQAQTRLDMVLAKAFGDDVPEGELPGGPIPGINATVAD